MINIDLMNADKARSVTEQKSRETATKYVRDVLEPKIMNAASSGAYSTNANLPPSGIQKQLVETLKGLGYTVDVHHARDQRDESYLTISWAG